MATKKSSGSKEEEAARTPAPKKDEVKASKKEVAAPPAPKKEEKKAEPLVSFARWFKAKKFKSHWAAGMEAYADTTRRRTMADWDRLFKNY